MFQQTNGGDNNLFGPAPRGQPGKKEGVSWIRTLTGSLIEHSNFLSCSSVQKEEFMGLTTIGNCWLPNNDKIHAVTSPDQLLPGGSSEWD